MRFGAHRVRAFAAGVALAMVLPLGAHAGAQSAAQRKGLALRDAPHYLDVGDSLPPSFRKLTPEEVVQQVGETPQDTATTVYVSDEVGAYVFLQMAIGSGTYSRTIFEDVIDNPEQTYTAEDFVTTLTDAEIPAEQISVSAEEWTDVRVGGGATSTLFTIEVAGEGALRFEVLLMLVERGKDTAIVEVKQLFEVLPLVDATEVARTIATKVRIGPPSAQQVIAEVGVITLADLPPGWEQAEDASGAAAVERGDAASDQEHDDVTAAAKGIPACKAFIAVLEADGTSANGSAGGSRSVSRTGPQYELGPAKVTSQVSVYPTAVSAKAGFDFFNSRSAKACVSKLYREIATKSIRSAAKQLPDEQRKMLDRVDITVTAQPSRTFGDEGELFTVTIDLRPIADVTLLVEMEFVRIGRAVGLYSFTSIGGGTLREDVLRTVTQRLADAPDLR